MLTVAIHDVAPSTLGQVEWLLERLDVLGITRRVLKVVPAELGDLDPEPLVALLRRETAAGSEVVLHGWSHHADGPLRGPLPDRLRARAFAAGAAEFLSLSDEQALERVTAGRERLAAWGLRAEGFCAPAWMATPSLPAILRGTGFRYLVTLRGLRDLRRGRWTSLPPRGYMGAGVAQERLVWLGGTVLSRPLRFLLRAPSHRFFLHPRSAGDSPDCARVLTEIAGLARTHRSVTYGGLLDG